MGSDDFDTFGRSPQRVQRFSQEARIVAFSFTVKVMFWRERSGQPELGERRGEPRTIVVERIEPFWGRSEVIRVFFVPVIDGGPDELLQGEREVDMER